MQNQKFIWVNLMTWNSLCKLQNLILLCPKQKQFLPSLVRGQPLWCQLHDLELYLQSAEYHSAVAKDSKVWQSVGKLGEGGQSG